MSSCLECRQDGQLNCYHEVQSREAAAFERGRIAEAKVCEQARRHDTREARRESKRWVADEAVMLVKKYWTGFDEYGNRGKLLREIADLTPPPEAEGEQ